MAEQKKAPRRSTAKAPAKAEAKEAEVVTAEEVILSKEGNRRKRVLMAERGRLDAELKQALKLRAKIDAIDKEMAELR